MDEQTNIHYDNTPPASLRNFLNVLFRRKRIILTFFIIVVVVVTAGSFLMPHIYQSESKLLIEKEADPEKAMLFRMNVSQGYNNYDFINSEIEILSSYPIAARVVKQFQSRLSEDEEEELTEKEKNDHFEKTITEFQKKIEIENPKNSNILIVRYENKDAALAAEIANYFVEYLCHFPFGDIIRVGYLPVF